MIRLPSDTQRLTIVGRTGSGKTQAAVWHLSKRRFDLIPWIVLDYKYDPLINSIEDAQHIDFTILPRLPGIYLIHPHPDDLEGVINYLWRIWEQENVGVYIDEGYMVGGTGKPNPAFRSLLTQGRSKHIPVITLSQRPVWLDRFVFSESDFYQIFALNDTRDRATVEAFVPADLDAKLPEYHSYYYDVGKDKVVVMRPVPEAPVILTEFKRRFEAMRKAQEKAPPKRLII